jgi:hypothetical protein
MGDGDGAVLAAVDRALETSEFLLDLAFVQRGVEDEDGFVGSGHAVLPSV